MADYAFLSSPSSADPNQAGLFGGVLATFRDGSEITIVSRGTAHETRQRYAYSLTQHQLPRTVAAGEDLYSAIGAPVDFRKALADFAVHADARADEDPVDGDAFQQWARRHDDELSDLLLQLEEDTQVWDEEVESIVVGFEFALCEVCIGDLGDHVIAPDALGHAHAYCLLEAA